MGKAVFRLDVIGWVCTAGSFMKGKDHDENLIREMEEGTQIPCTTASTAGMATFRQLGFKKICLSTPYPGPVNTVDYT